MCSWKGRQIPLQRVDFLLQISDLSLRARRLGFRVLQGGKLRAIHPQESAGDGSGQVGNAGEEAAVVDNVPLAHERRIKAAEADARMKRDVRTIKRPQLLVAVQYRQIRAERRASDVL